MSWIFKVVDLEGLEEATRGGWSFVRIVEDEVAIGTSSTKAVFLKPPQPNASGGGGGGQYYGGQLTSYGGGPTYGWNQTTIMDGVVGKRVRAIVKQKARSADLLELARAVVEAREGLGNLPLKIEGWPPEERCFEEVFNEALDALRGFLGKPGAGSVAGGGG